MRDEACFMGVVAGFPDGDDLVDRDVAVISFIIAQVQHAGFHFQHFTAHARRAAAVNVDLLPDEP
jgi:hypothetical protein